MNNLLKRFLEDRGNFLPLVKSGDIDLEKREVCFSFSSTKLIDHGFVRVGISHEKGAINLDRLNSGAGFYDGHDYSKQVGASVRGWHDNEKGYAVVKMSRSQRGEEILQDMVDGIRTGISMGFQIDDFDLEESPKDGGKPIIWAKKTTPFELTTTGIPADLSVGLGRSISLESATKEKQVMGGRAQGATGAPGESVLGGDGVDIHRTENERINEILAIGEEFNSMTLAHQYIREKKSPSDFSRAVMKKLQAVSNVSENSQIADADDIGLSRKEVRSFSLLRAINAVCAGDWSKAPFEREVSDAAAKLYGRRADNQSIIIPTDILNNTFRREVTSETAAGAIQKEVVGERFIEALWGETVAGSQLKVTLLENLRGELSMPKQTAKSQARWVVEGAPAEETDVRVGSITLEPNTVSAVLDVTRRTLMNSSFSMENMLRRDLLRALAYQIDHALIIGSANANEPAGILTSNDIGRATAASINYAGIIALETAVTDADVSGSSFAYLCNARVRGRLKSTARGDGTTNPVWETGPNGQGLLNGYPAIVSSIVPNDEAGTYLIFGLWSDAIVGQWGPGIEIQINPYNRTGNIELRGILDADIKFRHAESFAFINGIKIGGGTDGGVTFSTPGTPAAKKASTRRAAE